MRSGNETSWVPGPRVLKSSGPRFSGPRFSGPRSSGPRSSGPGSSVYSHSSIACTRFRMRNYVLRSKFTNGILFLSLAASSERTKVKGCVSGFLAIAIAARLSSTKWLKERSQVSRFFKGGAYVPSINCSPRSHSHITSKSPAPFPPAFIMESDLYIVSCFMDESVTNFGKKKEGVLLIIT